MWLRVWASSAANGSSIEEHGRIHRERPRELDAHAHPAGELVRERRPRSRRGGPDRRTRAPERSASARERPRARSAKTRFCRTVSQGKSAGSWNTSSRSGPGPVTCTPSTEIRPPLGERWPARA